MLTFSRVEEGLSKHQMALHQCLLLGLPICAEAKPDLMCSCGQPRDWYGYHRLNRKLHAGHAFRAANDVIQNQLARELRHLSLLIRDNDTDMRHCHSHLTTQKRGDIALIGTPASPTVYDPLSRLYRSDIIVDVKLMSMVSGLDAVLNPSALIQIEASKVTKYGHFMHLWAPASSPLLLPVLGASGLLPSVSYMHLQIMNWLNMMIG